MAAIRLRLADFIPAGGCWHAARTRSLTRADGRPAPLHRHDFPEVFWIEHGSCLHLVGGAQQRLAAGDLVLMRPDDAHTFAAAGDCVVANIAFAAQDLETVRRRYFAARDWPWAREGPPPVRRLGGDRLARLAAWMDRLETMLQDRLVFDAFLLDLLRLLGEDGGGDADDGPAWLRAGLAALAADPRLLEEGLPALARLCGRSPPHLSRTLRRLRGAGAEETLTNLRLDHAARRLRAGDPALETALACGFHSLGHFYRRFTVRFGAPPARWARQQRRIAGHG